MGLFSPPTPPTPPPPPPAANAPMYASGSTLGSWTKRQAAPMAGTDITGGQGVQKMENAAMGLGGNGMPGGMPNGNMTGKA